MPATDAQHIGQLGPHIARDPEIGQVPSAQLLMQPGGADHQPGLHAALHIHDGTDIQRQVEQGVVNRMQQRNARPGENGTRPGGAVQTKIDVSHMSRKEMEEMEKRVMRGEVITL